MEMTDSGQVTGEPAEDDGYRCIQCQNGKCPACSDVRCECCSGSP